MRWVSLVFFLRENITFLRKFADWKVLYPLVRNSLRSILHKHTIVHPLKSSYLYLINFLRKWIFSVRKIGGCMRLLRLRAQFEGACWAYAYSKTCIRMLIMRLQFVHVCSAYVYKLFAYAQHALTKKVLILTFESVCSACTYKLYAEQALTTWTRILSMRIQFVQLWWAYACQLHHIISRTNKII